MLERFGYDLGAGFFSGTGNTFSPDAGALAIIGVLGVLTAAAAALAVTRPLARLDVAQALKDRHLDLPSPPGGWSWPLALAAGALVAAFLPPAGEIPVGGYLSIGLALAAAVMAVSPASRLLLDRVPASDAPLRTLARAQVKSLPGHLSAMVSGIVVSVALTAAMAIMVHSFRVSLDGWLTGVLEADLFARAAPQGDAVVFSPDAQAKMAAVPGVARIDPIRFERLTPDGTHGAPHDHRAAHRRARSCAASRPTRPSCRRARGRDHGVDLGGGRGPLRLEGRAGGDAAARRDARHLPHRRHLPRLLAHLGRAAGGPGRLPRASPSDTLANDIAIHLKPGADAKAVEAALGRIVAQVPGAELHDASFIHGRALAIFDRTFAATYALEAAAILIALAGVTSSFAALAWSRRREFGVLRHLGLSRGEVMQITFARRRGRGDHRRDPGTAVRGGGERGAGARGEPAVVPLGHGDPLAVAGAALLSRPA